MKSGGDGRGAVSGNTGLSRTAVILLAAGGSIRMEGRDKLLEDIDGIPLLRRCAVSAIDAKLGEVYVVMQPDNAARDCAIEGLKVTAVPSVDWRHGMAASIGAGITSVSSHHDSVIIALADMPDVTCDHFNRLAAAYDPASKHEICRAVSENGQPGLPVLFGKRFFKLLATLSGDRGARDIINNAPEFLVDVKTKGNGALVDLDTPEQWQDWRDGIMPQRD